MAENPLITKAAQDVPPDTSAGTESTTQKAEENAGPVPDAGKSSGDKADSKDKGARTLENVTGEFNRKIGDMKSEFANGLAEVKGMIQGMATQMQAPVAAATTPDVNKMSASELAAMATHIPAEQKPAFDALLAQKQNAEAVNQQVDQRFQQHTFDTSKREADRQAFVAYPEMRDPLSRLRQEANNILNEMGAAASANPQAILHAAQAAGQRLGVKARALPPQGFGNTVGGRTAPAPDGGAAESGQISDENAEKIAKSLGAAMPGGKFTDEQMARIKKNSAEYRKHKNLFIRQ